MVKAFKVALNELRTIPNSNLTIPADDFEVACFSRISELSAEAFNIDEFDFEKAIRILDYINNEKMEKLEMRVNQTDTFENNVLHYNYLHFVTYAEQLLL